MRKRYGITTDKEGNSRMIFAIVTGTMDDGTKVWTECDERKELVNIDTQYLFQTRGGWSEFIRL